MKILRRVFLLALICSITASSSECFNANTPHFERIVGGYRLERHEYAKYLASLRYGDDGGILGSNHMCAGSIITEKVILTAAHCVTKLPLGLLKDKRIIKVVVGIVDRLQHSPWEQVFDVKHIVRHDEFDPRTGFADLALLVLDGEIEEDGVHKQRIVLADSSSKAGENCITPGWGQIIVNGPLSDELVYMNVTLLDVQECALTKQTNARSIICAGDVHGQQKIAGKGDSGGPLICDGKLAGVSSFVSTLQTYYTAVYFFHDWIYKSETSAFLPNFILLKFFVICHFIYL